MPDSSVFLKLLMITPLSLLDKVKEVQIENGFNKIIGPTNFTTNDSCGILTSGFEDDPVFLMPYNKAYYPDFLIDMGLNN